MNNILILGFGREGVSTLNYLLNGGVSEGKISIYDQHPKLDLSPSAQLSLSNHPKLSLKLGIELKDFKIEDYDIIYKSPGIPNKDIPPSARSKITSQTQLFFNLCPAPIIGVTGTKGKSTTSSLIKHFCQFADIPSILIGNIGTPPLDNLAKIKPATTVIFELSSHQLSTLKKSPHIAVLLDIYPEHLDYYHNMAEYVEAKSHITKFQTHSDYLIFISSNDFTSQIASTSEAQLIQITKNDINKARVMLKDSLLMGDMNAINLAAASEVAKIIGINPELIKQAIKNFFPLAHRLEKIGTYHNITFYNDSLSTIPEATIAALNTLGNMVSTLIIGGFERNLSYQKLALDLLTRTHLKNLILFPTTGSKIWAEILKLQPKARERFNIVQVDNMRDAVSFAYKNTEPSKICLLSPGATSFVNFRDYQDRGDQFRNQVKNLSA